MSNIDDKLFDKGLVGTIKPTLGPLKQRFLYPPFSVMNTRDGMWQDRRRRWISLGIKSEIGRGAGLTYDNVVKAKAKYDAGLRKPQRHEAFTDNKLRAQLGMRMSGTSIFDPVLTELAYTWWCPPEGIILDPFAGGSVRGIVASVLGFKYWGSELRAEQVEGNRLQLNDVTTGKFKPKWICGDSSETVPNGPPADFVFSCPPYGNLESYSDNPKDISSFSYEQFMEVYFDIINKSCQKLKDNRFAAFVVANYRDKVKRVMRNFVGDTIRCFEKAGLTFYNDAILVNAVGTGALRTNTNFVRGHAKLVKLHQNLLVFVKGDESIAGSYLPTFEGEEQKNVDGNDTTE